MAFESVWRGAGEGKPVFLGVRCAWTGWEWGVWWGTLRRLAKVLNRWSCLRTPSQFLPSPGDLPGDLFFSLVSQGGEREGLWTP